MAARRTLDPETVLAIRCASGNYSERARAFKVHYNTVRQIDLGLIYRDVLAAQNPRQQLSCNQCVHHLGCCTMNFPEYRARGTKAAQDCATYWESREVAKQPA